MEPVGIKNAWKKKVLITTATIRGNSYEDWQFDPERN